MRRWRWLLACPALIAALAPGAVKATATDPFDRLDGWVVNANGGNGVRADGQLRFSYAWGEISRVFLVEEPSVVTVTVRVFNGNTNRIGPGPLMADTYLVAAGGQEVRRNAVHGWETVKVQTATERPAEPLLVRLGGIDAGFWWGWYGPVMDDLTVEATPLAPPTTTEPETTTTTTTTVETTTSTTSTSSTSTTVPEPTVTAGQTSTSTVPATTSTSLLTATSTSSSSILPAASTTTSTTLAETTSTTSSTVLMVETVPAPPDEAHTVTLRRPRSGTTMTPEQRTTVVAATLLLIFPTSTVAGPGDPRRKRR